VQHSKRKRDCLFRSSRLIFFINHFSNYFALWGYGYHSSSGKNAIAINKQAAAVIKMAANGGIGFILKSGAAKTLTNTSINAAPEPLKIVISFL
jgi:hypothetical protein